MADLPTNMYDDALQSVTQTSTQRTLFEKGVNGCIDNATAIVIINTGAKDAFVASLGHCGETVGAKSFVRLRAGSQIVFSINSNGVNSISKIVAKTSGSDSTTLSWGVMERR